MCWIECKDLQKEYRCGSQVQMALNHVNFKLEQGEYVAIVGRSGSGKSTLMNMLGLIDTPTGGSILWKGEDILRFPEYKKTRIRNQMIGYVFQAFYLEPSYTVYQNIEMPLLIAGYSRSERRARILSALQEVGLSGKKRQRADSLSGGEKQRVSIARALVNQPELILADEPCGNLDSENTEIIMKLFDRLHGEGKTIVLITHSQEDAERAKRKITMKDGCVLHETLL
ncbi:ABC transporter ATP-binding protein [Ruminococcus sp.]|uniref:ABC transporter ATP-binding protein n=1 Tax=Ruminococcus sp. TaxID=41978 RepID=UPI003F102A02